MNRLKKYASLLLALVMALALAVPAMATEASGPAPVTGPFEITITNATTGHTYEAYQIFKEIGRASCRERVCMFV